MPLTAHSGTADALCPAGYLRSIPFARVSASTHPHVLSFLLDSPHSLLTPIQCRWAPDEVSVP